MKKLDYITVLRAIAILLVLLVHISQQSNGIEHIHPYILSVINNGARGVQLFYLLSAFTLFHSFSYRSSSEATPVKNYFIRRFFRIAPLYYLAIIYYLWQDGGGPKYWTRGIQSISTANIISNFTFAHGFSPYWINSLVPGGWSVSIEVMFYCFLPYLFYRIKNIQQACNFLLIALVIRCVLNIFFQRHIFIPDQALWREYLFLYLPNQLPVFATGILLYFIIYNPGKISISPKTLFAGSALLIAGACLQQNLIISDLFIFGIAFLILTIALQRYHPVMLFNPVFKYIGQISYTLYLTHWAAIYFLNNFKIMNRIQGYTEPLALLNLCINYGMVLTISIILSTILYYSIELPMQQFGKRLIKKGAQ